jgi:hypothetical protein
MYASSEATLRGVLLVRIDPGLPPWAKLGRRPGCSKLWADAGSLHITCDIVVMHLENPFPRS